MNPVCVNDMSVVAPRGATRPSGAVMWRPISLDSHVRGGFVREGQSGVGRRCILSQWTLGQGELGTELESKCPR